MLLQASADSFTLCLRLAEPDTRVVPSPSRSWNIWLSRLSRVTLGWVRVTGMEKVSPPLALW